MKEEAYSWTVEEPLVDGETWAACLWGPGFLGVNAIKIEADSFIGLCRKVVNFTDETNSN